MKTAIESFETIRLFAIRSGSNERANSIYIEEITKNTAIIADSLKLLVDYIVDNGDSK